VDLGVNFAARLPASMGGSLQVCDFNRHHKSRRATGHIRMQAQGHCAQAEGRPMRTRIARLLPNKRRIEPHGTVHVCHSGPDRIDVPHHGAGIPTGNMASEFSFDIVAKVDEMEAKNAIDQAQRELANRYDFKGSKASVELEKLEVKMVADDEFRMDQLRDIVESKLIRRGIDLKMVERGKVEESGQMTVKQTLTLKSGLSSDEAKALNKLFKENKALKVNTQIQGDAIRVSSKSKDDLQKAMTWVKAQDLPYVPDFTNYR